MNPVRINGILVAQPKSGGIKEEYLQIYHDRMLINGTLRRHFFGLKRQATLTWDALGPSDYAQLINLFTSGNQIVYTNTMTGLSFSGLTMHEGSTYIPGSSLLRSLNVMIREV